MILNGPKKRQKNYMFAWGNGNIISIMINTSSMLLYPDSCFWSSNPIIPSTGISKTEVQKPTRYEPVVISNHRGCLGSYRWVFHSIELDILLYRVLICSPTPSPSSSPSLILCLWAANQRSDDKPAPLPKQSIPRARPIFMN